MMSPSIKLAHQRIFGFTGYLYTLYSYQVLSRFKSSRLNIPQGKAKGVVLSFDVETWEGNCGCPPETCDPEDEYHRYVPELLDLFKDYSISAQFFVCGKVLALYPEVIKMVLEKGHGVGGHGYTHERMYSLSGEEQRRVVEKVASLLNEDFGVGLRSWRCPGLAANLETYRVLNKCGVEFCSNAPWGKPSLIEGVIEMPLVRKMDNEILEHNDSRNTFNPTSWIEYMRRKFSKVRTGITIFGMHTWVQRKHDPKCEALTRFLNFLEDYRDEVWLGRIEDLCLDLA